MKIGTWNVTSLYRAGSLKAAARELATYKLDVVGVQEVRWDKRHTVRAEDCDFVTGKEMNIINLEHFFFCTS
jgi:exonuclease III